VRGLLTAAWRPRLAALLPADPGRYEGPALARWFAVAYLGVVTVRSLIHLLAPDGGPVLWLSLCPAGEARRPR
jgi:hypothetical protein